MKAIVHMLVAAVIASTCSLILEYWVVPFSNWWWSLIFFILLFAIMNMILSLRSGDPRSMAETMLGTILIKTLLLLFAVFLYSLFDKAGLKAFCAHFITHYILFTVIEIRYLSGLQKSRTS